MMISFVLLRLVAGRELYMLSNFWLPARWASGFSCDHQQNHQCLWFQSCYNVTHVFEGILPKGPYLPCVSMAGRALFAGYHRILSFTVGILLRMKLLLLGSDIIQDGSWKWKDYLMPHEHVKLPLYYYGCIMRSWCIPVIYLPKFFRFALLAI